MEVIICHGILADGSECDGQATVTAARFVYVAQTVDGEEEQVLTEVVYSIACPKCGNRSLVDRADSNDLPSAAIQAAREALAEQVPHQSSHVSRSSSACSNAFFVQLHT